MTVQEFSDSFDTLLNSYNVQAGFGEGANKQGGITLDEYEKSVLLTQAQDMIVKSYFDRTLNSQGQGFDDSARRQVDFSSLIKVRKFLPVRGEDLYDDRGWDVTLPKNILFMLNEKLEIGTGEDKRIYVVVPINYREYDREMSKAYAQPLKKQAWRLFSNAGTGYDIKSELIPIYSTTDDVGYEAYRYYTAAEKGWEESSELPAGSTVKGVVAADSSSLAESVLPENPKDGSVYQVVLVTGMQYVIRYVQRPTPIILRPLPNNLTIDGYKGTETTDFEGNKLSSSVATGNGLGCSLNPILHMDILNRAFELAVTTRGGGTAQRQQQDNQRQQ